MTIRDRSCRWLAGLAFLAALAGGLPGCSDCSTSISTKSLPAGVVGTNYFAELNSDCGGDTWFIQDGSLPPGIELQDNGDVQGNPTLEGNYVFTVGVYDFGSGDTAYKGLSIRVTRAEDTAAHAPSLVRPNLTLVAAAAVPRCHRRRPAG